MIFNGFSSVFISFHGFSINLLHAFHISPPILGAAKILLRTASKWQHILEGMQHNGRQHPGALQAGVRHRPAPRLLQELQRRPHLGLTLAALPTELRQRGVEVALAAHERRQAGVQVAAANLSNCMR